MNHHHHHRSPKKSNATGEDSSVSSNAGKETHLPTLHAIFSHAMRRFDAQSSKCRKNARNHSPPFEKHHSHYVENSSLRACRQNRRCHPSRPRSFQGAVCRLSHLLLHTTDALLCFGMLLMFLFLKRLSQRARGGGECGCCGEREACLSTGLPSFYASGRQRERWGYPFIPPPFSSNLTRGYAEHPNTVEGVG